MNSSDLLRKSILELYKWLRKGMRQKWKRDLPFEEMLFDRWERARSLGFGEGSSIYHNSYVYSDVTVGKNTWIGPYTLMDGSGGLTIGGNCSISAGVHIYTHDTVRWALSGGEAEHERAPVNIGSCCHIGAKTVIAKGVTIGHHCAIGACSFVNRDIQPYTIAVGTPCKPAGVVNIEDAGNIAFLFDRD